MNPKQMYNKIIIYLLYNLLFNPFYFYTIQMVNNPRDLLVSYKIHIITTSPLWNMAKLCWILIHLTQPDLHKPSSDLCPLRAPSFNIGWRAQTVITNRWLQQRDGRSNQREIAHYHAITQFWKSKGTSDADFYAVSLEAARGLWHGTDIL